MEKGNQNGSTRVYSDGCYDVYHYGHANQLLQAKRMGEHLVVGVHSDSIIVANKGPPVIREQDRYKIIRSIRWVDELVEGAQYDATTEMLDSLKCDFFVHGSDLFFLPDGSCPILQLQKEGRFRECPRTEGISTTDLVGRMLLLTCSHHSIRDFLLPKHLAMARELAMDSSGLRPWVTVSQFDDHTSQIHQLIKGHARKPTDRVIFVDGNFDLFHIGHIQFLEEASKRGDYLVVGVHNDRSVNYYNKHNYPIMALHERVLGLLGCKYIDEILISSPYHIPKELLDHYEVHSVLHGRTGIIKDANDSDPFQIPKQLGKFELISSGSEMSTSKIMQRIIENRLSYEIRNQRSLAKQKAALEIIFHQ